MHTHKKIQLAPHYFYEKLTSTRRTLFIKTTQNKKSAICTTVQH